MSPKKNPFNFQRGVQSLKIPKKKKIGESERSITSKPEKMLKISTDFKEEDSESIRGKDIQTFIRGIEEREFDSVQGLKMKLLDYIFEMRIVKDSEFDEIYAGLVGRFKGR